MDYKRVLILAVVILLAFCPIQSFAAGKIGVVDIERIVADSHLANEATERLREEFEPRRKDLQRREQKIADAEDLLKRDSMILGDKERNKKERELFDMQRDLKRDGEDFREDLELAQNQERAKLLKKVKETIDAIGETQKFDLIVFKEGVAFASAKIDITNAVLEKLAK